MSNLGTHGTVDIVEATLSKYNLPGNGLDITALITSINITENITKNSIEVAITVVDTVGLLVDYPLRGEEILILSLKDPMMEMPLHFELFIYSISNINLMHNNDGARYILNATTRMSFQAGIRKVVSSFEKPASMIVKTIFEQTYDKIDTTSENILSVRGFNGSSNYEIFKLSDNRSLTVEDTESIVKCIIPNYSPQKAMNFLANRSISHDSSPSCSFKFYETKSGYMFVTDEFLIRQALRNENGNQVKKFYYNPFQELDPLKIEQQYNKIKLIDIINYVDTVSDLNSGTYNSRILEIDALYGRISDVRFDKNKYAKVFPGIDSGRKSDLHTTDFTNTFFNEENERLYVFLKDYDTYSDVQLKGNQYIPEIAVNRMAYNYRIEQIKIRAAVDGRLDISVGDVIYLTIPELTTDINREESKKLAGNYLISGVTHIIKGKQLQTEFIMSRYGWGE